MTNSCRQQLETLTTSSALFRRPKAHSHSVFTTGLVCTLGLLCLCSVVVTQNAGDVTINGIYRVSPPNFQGWTRTFRFPTINSMFRSSPQSVVISPDGQIMVLSFVMETTEFLNASRPRKVLREGKHAFVYLKCDSKGRKECRVILEQQYRAQFAPPSVVNGVMYAIDVCHSHLKRMDISDGRVKELPSMELNMNCMDWSTAHTPLAVTTYRPSSVAVLYLCRQNLPGTPCNPMFMRVYSISLITGQCNSLIYAYERRRVRRDQAAMAEDPILEENYPVLKMTDAVVQISGCKLVMFSTHGLMLLDLPNGRLSVHPLTEIIAGAVDELENIYVAICSLDNLANAADFKSVIYKMKAEDIIHNTAPEDLTVIFSSKDPQHRWIISKMFATQWVLGFMWSDHTSISLRGDSSTVTAPKNSSQLVIWFHQKNGAPFSRDTAAIAERNGEMEQSLQCLNFTAVQGGWSEWGSWSKCSVTCGQGEMVRKRQCSNPRPTGPLHYCVGPSVASAPCVFGDCRSEGEYGQWGQWGKCSVTCGSGYQQRARVCHLNPGDGQDCLGDGLMTQACLMPCLPSARTAKSQDLPQDGIRVLDDEVSLILFLLISTLCIPWFMVDTIANNYDGVVATTLEVAAGFSLMISQIGFFMSLFHFGHEVECQVGLVLHQMGSLMASCFVLVFCGHCFCTLKGFHYASNKEKTAHSTTVYFVVAVVIPTISMVINVTISVLPRHITDQDECWFSSSGVQEHLVPNIVILVITAILAVIGSLSGKADTLEQHLENRHQRSRMRSGLEISLLMFLSWTILTTYYEGHISWVIFLDDLCISLHTFHCVFVFFSLCNQFGKESPTTTTANADNKLLSPSTANIQQAFF